MDSALERQAQEKEVGRPFPVIPILLPEADLTANPLFLHTWVDLRRDLRDPQELAGIVRAIVGEISQIRPGTSHTDPCPYRGLEVFREEDTALFRGREKPTDKLIEIVHGRNLVVVVGSSGSGKSSLVQAGLLPRLDQQKPPAETWDAAIFTPGERPNQHLAAALLSFIEPDLSEVNQETKATKPDKDLAGGDVSLEFVIEWLLQKTKGINRLLLVADQFEELFTTTPANHRGPFIARLLEVIDRTRLTVVITLRADFYGQALDLSREFADRIEQGMVNLGPMTRKELTRSIREPAAQVGVRFEPGLVDKILDDVTDQPGNLPLLEFALTELWEQRQDNVMTHIEYRAIGGVTGSITKRAESVYGKFSDEQQQVTRRLFTRLVQVASAEEDNQDTRRRVALAELEPATRPIVLALVRARFLIINDDTPAITAEPETDDIPTEQQPAATARQGTTVEIAHEALIRGWDQLRGWLNQDREFLLWRQRLDQAQTRWDQMQQDPGSLLRGAALTEAEGWLHQRPQEINADERTFIQAGLTERTREQQT